MRDEASGLQVPYVPLHAFRPADPAVPVPVARLGGPVAKKDEPIADLRRREADELAGARAPGAGRRLAGAGRGGHARRRAARRRERRVGPPRTLLRHRGAAADPHPARRPRARVRSRRHPAPHREPVAALRDHRVPRPGRDPRRDRRPRRRDPARRRAAHPRVRMLGRRPPRLPRGRRSLVDLRRRARGAAARPPGRSSAWPSCARSTSATSGRPRPRPSSGSCGSGRCSTIALAHRRPRDHWRRLRFLTDAAHAFTDAGGASLRGFVQWLDEQKEEGARVNESVLAEPDDDAVRVLTIHGSKGLEFPVVLLAGLGVGLRANPARAVPRRPEPRGPPDHADRGLLHHRRLRRPQRPRGPGRPARGDAPALRRDDARTRPPRRQPPPPRGHPVARRGDPGRRRRARAPVAGRDRRSRRRARPAPRSPCSRPSPAGDAARRSPHERRSSATRGGARGGRRSRSDRARPIVAATAHRARRCDRRPTTSSPTRTSTREVEPEDDRPAWRRGRGATALGRAVHAVLQTVDLASGAGIEGAARAQAMAEGIPDREESDRRHWPGASSRRPTVRAAAGARSWREVPVAAEIDGTTIEGFVDLLVEIDGELVVVDYKTDAARTEAEIDAARRPLRAAGRGLRAGARAPARPPGRALRLRVRPEPGPGRRAGDDATWRPGSPRSGGPSPPLPTGDEPLSLF